MFKLTSSSEDCGPNKNKLCRIVAMVKLLQIFTSDILLIFRMQEQLYCLLHRFYTFCLL